MDWLQFIAAMFGHLAWPAVVLIVAFAVRKHLGSLAERILELSFGGATVKFDKLLSKGAELIEQKQDAESAKTPGAEQIAQDELSERLDKHLDRLVVLRSQRFDDMQALSLYRDIEVKLNEIGKVLSIPVGDSKRPIAREVIRELRAAKLIDHKLSLLFDTLTQGRNVLVHAGTRQLSQSEIEEYVRQASYFLVSMELLLEKVRKDKGG